MIPKVNIISGKTSSNVAGDLGIAHPPLGMGPRGWALSPSAVGFRGRSPLRKVLGCKEHLDWMKIDLNARL